MKASAETIILFFALVAAVLLFPAPDAHAVHEVAGSVRCLDCHSWLPLNNKKISFRDEVGSICGGCHGNAHRRPGTFSHPVDVPSTMAVPRDMPLDPKGRINCVTCHRFHTGYKDSDGNKSFFLRRSIGKAFCYSCHKKPLF